MKRRDFVKTAAAAGVAGAVPRTLEGAGPTTLDGAPTVYTPQSVSPVVISDTSGIRFTNGGPESAVERAFRMIVEGADVLDALVAGVNIPELDPTETGIGYGGLPNANGVVQLDACCMHGPKKQAGGVAGLEGVRTPSLVAKAVMEYTDHHLLVGAGAQEFARMMGFEIEDDLNTDRSRELWLEWKRRIDPSHFPDPRRGRPGGTGSGAGLDAAGAAGPEELARARAALRDHHYAGYQAGLDMVREGLIDENSFWGTINCDGIGPGGDICGVTTTSGLSWKIPGRAGDSPILGAGLYVDGDIGAAGSTGRGEANLFNLCSFLIVEKMREGMHPRDAGMAALERIRANTVEERLLNSRGEPNFNVRFFALNKRAEYAGVSMYASGQVTYAVCDENGARELPLEGLLEGSPTD
ncbi:MAG: N(4)-(beta-N-acetylglucosaminyl)-L-asparaginase [Gammaproteobacteria bacterium]|nr:N(4)-(beta-N-acetylglucosaminyl)-L-asparaginase [Gammaproteobacteria bacterium]